MCREHVENGISVISDCQVIPARKSPAPRLTLPAGWVTLETRHDMNFSTATTK